MAISNPSAFDALAPAYDDSFTNSRLGRLLRARVWQVLAESFTAGDHILEIACGTGEDAVWLAQRGISVTACDGSQAMVQAARAKADAAGVSGAVHLHLESLQALSRATPRALEGPFDGLLSNFGGLNTIQEWHDLGQRLAPLLQPGALAVLVPMGPFCPWEIVWFAGHGELQEALRRYRQPAQARIGSDLIPIWYPSARRLRAALHPSFELVRVQSLGLWLPPSYLSHLVDRFPRFFNLLNRLERTTAPLSGGWGDHYIAVFRRR